MTTNADRAEAMFREGFNCAQSVLTCCGGPLGLPREVALQVAGPLGGGLAGLGHVCGAVSGALMTIGLKHAKLTAQDEQGKQRSYQFAQEFVRRFVKRNGSIVCRDLIGCDISTPEGMQKARDQGVFKTLCPKLVRDGAEIVGELLAPPKSVTG